VVLLSTNSFWVKGVKNPWHVNCQRTTSGQRNTSLTSDTDVSNSSFQHEQQPSVTLHSHNPPTSISINHTTEHQPTLTTTQNPNLLSPTNKLSTSFIDATVTPQKSPIRGLPFSPSVFLNSPDVQGERQGLRSARALTSTPVCKKLDVDNNTVGDGYRGDICSTSSSSQNNAQHME
jgi:hypothetical protein